MNKLMKPSRRSFLKGSAALGATTAASGLAIPAFADGHLPDPQSVLDDISVAKYVREDYQQLYNMSGETVRAHV